MSETNVRTITLSLEKAKEFYKSGWPLNQIAFLAFNEEELTKKELPSTWKEFCEQNKNVSCEEVYINSISEIEYADKLDRDASDDRNLLASKEDAEQHLALMQLHRLRDCYRQGWKPSIDSEEMMFCIERSRGKLKVSAFDSLSSFLSFQSKDIAEQFLQNFQDLIEQAGDLLP